MGSRGPLARRLAQLERHTAGDQFQQVLRDLGITPPPATTVAGLLAALSDEDLERLCAELRGEYPATAARLETLTDAELDTMCQTGRWPATRTPSLQMP